MVNEVINNQQIINSFQRQSRKYSSQSRSRRHKSPQRWPKFDIEIKEVKIEEFDPNETPNPEELQMEGDLQLKL